MPALCLFYTSGTGLVKTKFCCRPACLFLLSVEKCLKRSCKALSIMSSGIHSKKQACKRWHSPKWAGLRSTCLDGPCKVICKYMLTVHYIQSLVFSFSMIKKVQFERKFIYKDLKSMAFPTNMIPLFYVLDIILIWLVTGAYFTMYFSHIFLFSLFEQRKKKILIYIRIVLKSNGFLSLYEVLIYNSLLADICRLAW